MAKSESKVRERLQHPLVRQFSVFLENKVGALLNLTRTLSDSNPCAWQKMRGGSRY